MEGNSEINPIFKNICFLEHTLTIQFGELIPNNIHTYPCNGNQQRMMGGIRNSQLRFFLQTMQVLQAKEYICF